MLSARMVQFISDHWKQVTERVVRHIQRDSRLLELGRYPEALLRDRASEILRNLGGWLVSSENELAQRYEQLGRQRFEDGIPLHEMVYAFQIIKDQMLQYVRDQGLLQGPIDIYAEDELQRGADRIFDRMIYYLVRGYEGIMRERMDVALRSSAALRNPHRTAAR